MADKFLVLNAGVPTEKVGAAVSAGVADAGRLVALDSAGKLDSTLLPTGIGADTWLLTASEALTAGNYVNVWNNAGVFAVRKADASTAGKPAHGFVLAAVASGAQATVYWEGTNTQVTGQTPGDVWLSATTPGAAVATPPSAAGQVVQKLGVAVSATAVSTEIGQHYVLA